MNLSKINGGKIKVEVSAINLEKVLNGLWKNRININGIKKIDMATMRFYMRYSDYNEAEKIILKCKGKCRIIGMNNMAYTIVHFNKKISLFFGIVGFFAVIFILSNFIWSIDIETKSNLSPFEVRKELKSIGITPGISKNKINVYSIEKKIEDIDDSIMWIRVRIEGSALKVVIKEKVNPPKIDNEKPKAVYAKMDGEIKNIFTISGNPAVMPGDIVKKGDELILPLEGREGFEKEVQPSGTVIANTFYKKYMEIQISGNVLKRTGRKQSDIYISVCNKKIYLKKHIEQYESYDKIEERKGLLNKIVYYEKKGEEIKLNKEEQINKCFETLEDSLKKSLSNDAQIVGSKIESEEQQDGRLLVTVFFTVEQNIAENEW